MKRWNIHIKEKMIGQIWVCTYIFNDDFTIYMFYDVIMNNKPKDKHLE